MKLRTKTIALFLVMTILVVAAVHAISYTLLSTNYQQLEEKETTETVQQIQSQLRSEYSALDGKLSSWSKWNDAYQFVEDNNSAFSVNTLVPSALVGLGVNFILFFSSSGDYVNGFGYNLTDNADIRPIPPSLIALISSDPKIWDLQN